MSTARHHRVRPRPGPVGLFLTSGQRNAVFRAAGCVVVLAAAHCHAGDAANHPFHVTVAEATMNLESGRLEVALRVYPDDLETALSRRANRRIELEKTKGVDELIVAYLNDVFIVRPAPPKKAPKPHAPPSPTPKPAPKPKVKLGDIHWVGKELQVQAAWLYFEVSLPRGIHRMEFSNRILFESQTRQINTMTIKEGAFKTSVRFTIDAPAKVIVIPDRP